MILGIEIGGTKLQLAIGEDAGHIIERRRFAVDPTQGADGIRQQIERALPELLGHRKARAAGVGFGGPVHWRTGKIARSHHIAGWADFDLASWLQKLIDAPVFIDNDANVAALAEATHGGAQGANPVFYVTLGSGVGGGLIVNGKIYHGAVPGEAEIGHVRLDRSGATVESRCSGWAVDARIRTLKTSGSPSVLPAMTRDLNGGEARCLAAAVEQGDTAARQILLETAQDLALGLSHAVHLFHPEVIVLGGGLSGIGEPLRAAVEGALAGFIMDAFKPGPRLLLSKLGEDAVPIGAMVMGKLRMSLQPENMGSIV